jgi:hypothetical protein
MLLRHAGAWVATMGLVVLATLLQPIDVHASPRPAAVPRSDAAFASRPAEAALSSAESSDRPVPPQPTDRRSIGMIAVGDWYYLDGGRVACESPGTTCLMITFGPVQVILPVAFPIGAP